MSRLTEREIEEIRRVQRAQPDQVREEVSEVRLAAATHARQRQPEVGLAATIWRALEKRRAAKQLHGLSDHMLRDVGIERGHIDLVLDELSRASAPRPTPVQGPLQALGRWLRSRRATAELSRLDDRLLRDIGVSRGEIPALVKRMETTGPAGPGRPANLSPQAADQIARLDAAALARLGFVKTAIDGLTDVTAARKVAAQ